MISQTVALLFLAVWHGYFIGYYICFMFELMIVQFELQVSFTPMVLPVLKYISFKGALDKYKIYLFFI